MKLISIKNMALVNELPELLKRKLSFELKSYTTNQVTLIEAFKETKEGFYIPRALIPNWQKYLEDAKWNKVNIPFKGKLYDYQQKLANNFLKAGSGVIKAETGTGKTVVALYIAHKLGLKTLIVVHRSPLIKQWKERIKQFTGIDAGLIKQNICNIRPPIVIASLQTLALGRRLNKEAIWNKFGLTIWDEVHRAPAEKLQTALSIFWDKHRLGLSATPRRKDGLMKVVFAHMGEIVASYSTQKELPYYVIIQYWSENSKDLYLYNGKFNLAKWLNEICNDEKRPLLVASIIKKVLTKNPTRKLLVLSDRLNLLYLIHAHIKNKFKVALLTGQIKGDLQNAQVILATYGCANEGVDIKGLDTLILATPRADIKQAVGRIMRATKNKPIVFDILDLNSLEMRKWGWKKRNFAEKSGWIIKKIKGVVEGV